MQATVHIDPPQTESRRTKKIWLDETHACVPVTRAGSTWPTHAGDKSTEVIQGQQVHEQITHLHGLLAGHATGGARRAAAPTPPHFLRPTAPEFSHTVSNRSGETQRPMQKAVPLSSSADPRLTDQKTHTSWGCTHNRGVAHTSGPIARLRGGGALPTTLRAGAAAERHRHLCFEWRAAAPPRATSHRFFGDPAQK